MKIVRRLLGLFALVALAVKGAISFLSWADRQDSHESVWAEEEELEEAF